MEAQGECAPPVNVLEHGSIREMEMRNGVSHPPSRPTRTSAASITREMGRAPWRADCGIPLREKVQRAEMSQQWLKGVSFASGAHERCRVR